MPATLERKLELKRLMLSVAYGDVPAGVALDIMAKRYAHIDQQTFDEIAAEARREVVKHPRPWPPTPPPDGAA